MLIGSESLPSTRPSSLFEYDTSQKSTITSASSWSTGEPSGQGSSSSLDLDIPTRRKRPRSSDASEIEVKRLASPVKSITLNDVFTTPKTHEEARGDSPKNPPLKTRHLAVPASTDTPRTISSFFQGTLGAALNPVVIAHSRDAQKLMDDLDLAWGAQYELARGVSLGQWTWEEVRKVLREKSNEFRGSNAETAFKVGALMRDRKIRDINAALWYVFRELVPYRTEFVSRQELDREQAAILENKARGLGLMGKWHGQDDWFGGRIQQIARLSKSNDNDGRYRIQLEPMEKRRSHRFARFCGSRRILQLRIPKDLILKESAQLKVFLQGKFILCGRVFVPFHAKDHSLYMVETNENWERKPRPACGDQYRLSFAEFINWHNPPEYNYKQVRH